MTGILGSNTITTGFDNKIFDSFNSAKIVNGNDHEYGYELKDGALTVYSGRTQNYASGWITLQVNQYDAEGVLLATGNLRVYEINEVATENKLIEAIANGKSVVLTSDIALTNNIEIKTGSIVTLNLNKHKLSYANTEAKASCAINNLGELTIMDGTVTYQGVGDTSYGYGTNTINNSGKLVIDGATLINTTAVGSSNVIDNAPGASLIVNDATITAELIAIRVRDGANATINSGVVSGKRAAQVHLIHNNKQATSLIINGGTFNGNGDQAIYSYAYGGCSHANTTITIAGGVFNGNVSFGGGNKNDIETVSVTGGTFNGDLGRYLANDGWEDIAKPQ